jgi:Kef-type K+ transport system membrane component KefB
MDRLFVSLGGVVILVSGAATYLQLSPVMSAMFFGIILVNTSRQYHEIRAVLARVERPLYFVLLIIAGAMWSPSLESAWVLPVLLFLVARAACKIGGARLAARSNGLLPALGPRWGHALLGQGGLVIALAVNYLYQGALAIPDVVFSAAVVSVLLTDLVSGRLASSVLEASEDAPSPPAEVAPRRAGADTAAGVSLAHRGAENA